ncbi:conserved hypothetical protein [uncultured Eubacteriales bacterium]|uniref:Uncharacterized protein n=1 Tax=uncultured Eubacteriales bacterium TaxID=172733 RepID=A0A212KFA3_9FIRM|nr:conserved hypothetical protein [uncultured Eubacteriales bacterium]
MEPAAGGGAGAGDVSRVLGNFRFYEHNVQHFQTIPLSQQIVLYRKDGEISITNPSKMR